MTEQLKPDDVDELVEILAAQASNALIATPQDFFLNLIASAHLPREWRQAMAGRWLGNANIDARRLVDFAITQKFNPEEPTYTTLGSLLRALLGQKLSPDDARIVVSIMVGYKLILDPAKLNQLKIGYGVPMKASTPADADISYGPDFQWRGPDSDLELQSFLTPEPPWQDVGFLRRAMKCASSVCRVEIKQEGGKEPITGTGFLVSDGLVLTNYHVLKPTDAHDIHANARKAVLRFAAFTSAEGKPELGLECKLADEEPIVEQSVVKELDFVLLRVEPRILAEESIVKVVLDPTLPANKSSLNLLHHPRGDTMKLSTSGNAVTGVYQDIGLVQYATNAAEGSSGSPCFTDDWKVVALHHGQKSRAIGSVREGILMKDILVRIHQHLNN